MKKIVYIAIAILALSCALLLSKNTLANSYFAKPKFSELYISALGEGKKAYEDFKKLQTFAKQGEAEAQFYLGRIYHLDQDSPHAVYWYNLAAEQNNADAQRLLGSIYATSKKSSQQSATWYTQAAENYRKAAESGDIIAQYKLALAYAAGLGVKQDTQQSTKWLTLAAEQGNSDAQNMLGYWLLTGRNGIKKDTEKGIEWCLKAAAQNNVNAENNLYHMYSEYSDRYDPKQYIYWLRRAAEHGDTDAQWQLGSHYEKGDCKDIEKDYQQAIYWYQRGAGRGSDCTFSLARMYGEGKGVSKDLKAEEFWNMRANAMFNRGGIDKFNLASMYETGNEFVSQDTYVALRWYRRAAVGGHSEAQYRLGKAHVEDKDFEYGIFWLKEAAMQDNPHAMQYLGIVYRDGLGVDKSDEYANQWFQEAENATARYNLRERLKAFGADAYIIGNNVNVRKFPKTSSEIVAQLNTGQAVKRGVSDSFAISQGGNVLTENGKWNFIQTEEGVKGWVLNKYLRTMILNIPNDKGFREVANRELKNNIKPTIILSKAQYNSFVSIFENGSLDKLKAKIEQEHISINAVYRSEDYSNIDANLLSIAVSYTSNLEIIKFLISKGADVNRKTTGWRELGPDSVYVSNMTALMKASICYSEGKPEIVKALLDAGADVNAKDSEGMTALDWALETSTVFGNSNTQTATKIIKMLLDVGADAKDSLDYAFSDKGVTPEILKMLLKAGAEVNNDSLMLAVINTEYPDVIELLLDAGANPKTKSEMEDFKGMRPVEVARNNSNLQGTQALKRLEEESYDSPEEREREEVEKKAAQQAEFQKLLQEAENGDVDAQSNIAFKYLLGMDGVEIDGEKAIYWFKKAAEQGDMSSTVKLSSLYTYGDDNAGIKKNEKEAEFWSKKANEAVRRHNGFEADAPKSNISKSNASNNFQANASITGDKVNIRTKPNTSSKVVKQLNAGHPVKATKQTQGKDGTWYFIQTASGTEGWVFGKYVKLK